MWKFPSLDFLPFTETHYDFFHAASSHLFHICFALVLCGASFIRPVISVLAVRNADRPGSQGTAAATGANYIFSAYSVLHTASAAATTITTTGISTSATTTAIVNVCTTTTATHITLSLTFSCISYKHS